MDNQIFIVIQRDTFEGTSWVEGVYATRELAEDYIETQEAELAKDGMEESYEFNIETSFLIKE